MLLVDWLKNLFVLQLVPYTHTACFPNQTVIAHHADPADRIIIVSSGRVAM